MIRGKHSGGERGSRAEERRDEAEMKCGKGRIHRKIQNRQTASDLLLLAWQLGYNMLTSLG